MKSNLKPWLYEPDWQGKRCGAMTRSGYPCRRPGNKINGRCKLHGGRSTGPRTKQGFARLITANTKHGKFSKAKREKARQFAEQSRHLRVELKELESWFVNQGHLDKNWKDFF